MEFHRVTFSGQVDSPKRGLQGEAMKVIGMIALMTVCGLVAMLMAASFLMNLGLKLHDNYEYYGALAIPVVVLCGVAGFAAPALFAWWLKENDWKFGLRDIFVIIAVVAVVLGIYALSL
jgi:hypothetical protein